MIDPLNSHNFLSRFMEEPYLLWHMPVKLCCAIFKTNQYGFVAGMTSGLFISATYILTFLYMRRFSICGASVMAFIASIVGPLYIPWISPYYYLGQGSPNTWHNPTNIAVKPFAVFVFFIVCMVITTEKKDTKGGFSPQIKKDLFIIAITGFISVFAKPSFIMAFVPAIGIFFVIRSIIERGNCILRYALISLAFIPAVMGIFYQFFAFFGEKTKAGIEIGWFRETANWTRHPFLSTILVLCFPMCFLLINFKREIKKVDIQLSLIYVVVGWLMRCLLYESGEREAHGNMGWAYLIALYVFWMVVLSHFLVDAIDFDIKDRVSKIKNGILMVLLSFHFLFGAGYIFNLITKPGYLI